jgi:hypothetical protein
MLITFFGFYYLVLELRLLPMLGEGTRLRSIRYQVHCLARLTQYWQGGLNGPVSTLDVHFLLPTATKATIGIPTSSSTPSATSLSNLTTLFPTTVSNCLLNSSSPFHP